MLVGDWCVMLSMVRIQVRKVFPRILQGDLTTKTLFFKYFVLYGNLKDKDVDLGEITEL